MKKILILLAFAMPIQAQRIVYDSLIMIANNEFAKANYQAASDHFLAGFKAMDYKGFADDRYAAAQALAMSNQTDSAFMCLERLYEKTEFLSYKILLKDTLLYGLHSNPRWGVLVNNLTPSNIPLATRLEEIRQLDQQKRHLLDKTSEQYGYESAEYKGLWVEIKAQDSINQLEVKQIIDSLGWLGPKEIGSKGSTTLYLVIQHADTETQAKYFPLFKQAAEEGRANKANVATMEDRLRLGQGQKQLYGTQRMTKYDTGKTTYRPIEDIEHLNERRISVGLHPFSAETLEEIRHQITEE